MNVWCFLSTVLFWNKLCNANPVTDIDLGFNCTGYTTATRLLSIIETIKPIENYCEHLPWYRKMFCKNPDTAVDVVKTYPSSPNLTCTITCARIHDIVNTTTKLQKIAGGIGDSFITIRIVTMPNVGATLNITLDGFCNTTVNITKGSLILGTPPSAPPAVLPPAYASLPPAYSPPAVLPPAYSMLPTGFAAPPAVLSPAFPAIPTSPLDEKSNASQPPAFGWVQTVSSLPRPQDFFNNTIDYRN